MPHRVPADRTLVLVAKLVERHAAGDVVCSSRVAEGPNPTGFEAGARVCVWLCVFAAAERGHGKDDHAMN
jgi:hypothetical protein